MAIIKTSNVKTVTAKTNGSTPQKQTSTDKDKDKDKPTKAKKGRGDYDNLPPAQKAHVQVLSLAKKLGQAHERLSKWDDDEANNISAAAQELGEALTRVNSAAEHYGNVSADYVRGGQATAARVDVGDIVAMREKFRAAYTSSGVPEEDLVKLKVVAVSDGGMVRLKAPTSKMDLMLSRRMIEVPIQA